MNCMYVMRDVDSTDANSLPVTHDLISGAKFKDDLQVALQYLISSTHSDAPRTHRNQQQSPLLRLPTEIRERIWTLAFGCRTLHVVCTGKYVRRGSLRVKEAPRITFYACHEYLSEHAIYALSLRGANPDKPGLYAAEELYNRAWKLEGAWQTIGRAGMHDSCVTSIHGHQSVPEPFKPVLICRQIHYEAMPLAWRTTSFAFTDDDSFGWFAKLVPEAYRRLVTELTILSRGFLYSHQWKEWHASFTPDTLAALPSLQGIHLVLNESVWFRGRGLSPNLRPDPSSLDVLQTFPDAHKHITGLIRLLRQRRLQPERTTVFLPQSFLYRPPEVAREAGKFYLVACWNDPHARWLCKPWRWHLSAGEMVEIARGIREVLLGGGEEGTEREAESEEWGARARMPDYTGDRMVM